MTAVTWLLANWSVVLTDAGTLLGGLVALDTALCLVFPNAGVLSSIQTYLKDAAGFISKV